MATTSKRMELIAALQVLRDVRADRIVVTSMGSAREWPRLSRHPLDLHYVPSTMGGVVPLGLGLALARPDREVVVLSGDGSLLMSLGSLVTVAASGVTNLSIIVLENAVYEVTGGQQTAAAVVGTDFAGLATAAGFRSVAAFDDLDHWRAEAAATLSHAGPRFTVLRVHAVTEAYQLESPGPFAPRLASFRQALGG